MSAVSKWVVGVVAAGLLAGSADARVYQEYPQVGGGPGHVGAVSGPGPTDLSVQRFAAGQDVYWLAEAGVVVAREVIVGLGAYSDQTESHMEVVAVSERTGEVLWRTTVPAPVLESWSSPAIDSVNRVVVVASGDRVTGLSLVSGAHVWDVQASGGRSFVNASPTIDGGVAYIVEFGGGSLLRAIDTATGEVLWTAPVGTASGANTVAVADGRVMLVTSDGRFRTFDQQTGAAGVSTLISPNGFFSGVAAAPDGAYAVSFTFGGNDPTKLYKVDPATGSVIWSAVAPRTDTIPVIAGDVVLVSGGDGYRMMWDETDDPGLWAYDAATGAKLWHTDIAGGWTCQPVVVGQIAYVPTLSDGPAATYPELYAFDLTKTPADAGFVAGSTEWIDNPIAFANGNIYGTWSDGGWGGELIAIGPALGPISDMNGDGLVNAIELLMLARSWATLLGDPGYDVACDLNDDGIINVIDLLLLSQEFGT